MLQSCILVSLDRPRSDERTSSSHGASKDVYADADSEPYADAGQTWGAVDGSGPEFEATFINDAEATSGTASDTSSTDASALTVPSDTSEVDEHVAAAISLPTIDASCDHSGELACDVNNPTQKLVCSQARWQSNGGCDEGDNCNPHNGRCKTIIPECEGAFPGERRCAPNDELVVCGPNGVSVDSRERCFGRCIAADDTAQCAEPFCGDGKVQDGETCDDGNSDNADDCTQLCAPPVCGEGTIYTTKHCDESNGSESDDCTPGCRSIPKVAAGYFHTCATGGDGTLKCWGGNERGQLGLGDVDPRGTSSGQMGEALPVVNLGTYRTALTTTTGFDDTCTVLNGYSFKCWGGNQYGQLGLGDRLDRGTSSDQMGDELPTVSLGLERSVLRITSGGHHHCALLDDQSIKCWGSNSFGELGLDDIATSNLGDAPGELGDALPSVNLGTDRTALAIASRAEHTCALLDDRSIKCWGNNEFGQLGRGYTGDICQRGGPPRDLRPLNTTECDAGTPIPDALPSVNLGTNRTALTVAAGRDHTCAILDDRSVKCWGGRGVGLGDNDVHGAEPNEMGDALLPVELGTGRTALAIAAGLAHTCAILDDRSVKCWGDNTYGQLGLGDTNSRGDEAGEMGDELLRIDLGTGRTALGIVAGAEHTCAVVDDSTVKCWGRNLEGQLGLGDTNNRGDEPDEMGDELPAVSIW